MGVTQGTVSFWSKSAVPTADGMALVSDSTLSDGVKWQQVPPLPPNDGKTYALTAANAGGVAAYTWIETTDCPPTPPTGGATGGSY